MSYVFVAPEALTAASARLTGIGSAVNAANAGAAAATTQMLAAGGDEVSAAIAQLFGGFGEEYQMLTLRAAVHNDQFVQALTAGAGSYAAAEAINVQQVLSSESITPLDLINKPLELITGRGLIEDGANGYTSASGIGTPGKDAGWLWGNGGNGGNSTSSHATSAGAGGSGGLIGNGGNGGNSGIGGVAGGAGGAAMLFGNGGTGGLSGPGGLGGAGGAHGLLWGQAGATGASTPLPSNAIVVHLTEVNQPLINISVGGGPRVSAIFDTGSVGLVIGTADVNVDTLGPAMGTGQVTYGNSGQSETFVYTKYQVPVDLGNGIVTAPITIGVTNQLMEHPIIGFGSNTGPLLSSPSTALSGSLNQGELLDEPAGLVHFGPNPLPAGHSLTGAPITTLKVQINGGPMQSTMGAYVDSGGLNGVIPANLVPAGGISGGSIMKVYNNAGQLLYSETFSSDNFDPGSGDFIAGNLPYILPAGQPFNSGNYPFSVEPIYISNSPSGGSLIFD